MCLLLEFPTPHPQIGWVLTHGPQSHRLIRTHQWQKKLEMMLTSWLGFWRLLSWVPAKISTFLQFSMQSLVPGLGVVVPIPVFPQQREKSFVSKRNKNATFYMTFFLFFWDFFLVVYLKHAIRNLNTILSCVGVRKQELFPITGGIVNWYYIYGCHINSIWQVVNVHSFHSRIWPLEIHPVNVPMCKDWHTGKFAIKRNYNQPIGFSIR